MSNRFAIKPLFILIACIGLLIGLYTLLPVVIRGVASHHLQHAVAPLRLPPPKVGLDYVRYRNVSLDPDGINTLGTLTFLFTPYGLVRGHFHTVIIEDAEIIASVSEERALVLDGWLGQQGLQKALTLRARSLRVRDADITLLTETYGGITLHADMTASLTSAPHEKPLYEFQSRFESQQRYISLSGTGSGSFSPDFISTEAEFERGKVSIPDFSLDMMRLSGWGRFTYNENGLSAFSELRSGGMRLGSLPWQNAAMTYKYENEKPEIFLSAHSLGLEGIELALNQQDETISTRIHTASEERWNQYVAMNSIQGEELDALVDLLSRLNTEIELE